MHVQELDVLFTVALWLVKYQISSTTFTLLRKKEEIKTEFLTED